MATHHTLTFLPRRTVVRVPAGVSVFEAASWAGISIDSTCGARGTCGKCRVRLCSGELPVTEADRRFYSTEEIEAGWRLACRAHLGQEAIAHEFEVPERAGTPKAALFGRGRHVVLAPSVQKRYEALPPPTLHDQGADLDRLRAALSDLDLKVPAAVLRTLPGVLRAGAFEATAVVVGDTLVAVEPGDTSATAYGVALDVGTTTVVGALVDLVTGATAALASRFNRQERFGADVISRIAHAMTGDGALDDLRREIVATVDDLLAELYATAGVEREVVYHAVVVGNTTMLHLLLGVDPGPLALEPFAPAFREPLDLDAGDCGLAIHPQGRVQTFPLIGAYVGADTVAGILATGLGRDSNATLLIDIGTNGELVLAAGGRIVATAAPAGPAFDRGHIRCGMRAAEGAIEGVALDGGVELQVVGDTAPVGICGSGLADVAAGLLDAGLVSRSGRLARGVDVASHPLAGHLEETDGGTAFRLAPGIHLTQADVRELQLAKGAIASGAAVLMRLLGIEPEDLDQVLLAGSFGTYINPASARAIGLAPSVDASRISSVGNAALEGAKMALLSFREHQLGRDLPQWIEYVELSAAPGFNDTFLDSLEFPELAAA